MKQIDFVKNELTEIIFHSLNNLNQDHGLTLNDVWQSVEIPTDTSKGDYAFPCFKLAKSLKKAPAQIANDLNQLIDNNKGSLVKNIAVVGGFLNFFIDHIKVAEKLFPMIGDGSLFQRDKQNTKVMIEYSQPNTHKEFHVGHGRNVCLGDSISRLYHYNGFNTMPVNYIGDEGTHIAKCLFAVKRSNEKIPSIKRAQWLGERYVEANNILSNASDEERKIYDQEISQILRDIESKEGETFKLWEETRQYCLDDFNEIYQWLDVHFDHFFYESEVSEASQKIVDQYLEKGLFKHDQGAVGIDMSDAKLGFMMVRKSDGNSLYITKDIALAEVKFDQYGIDQNIYVVANEQDYHFKQLFHFLKLAGFKQADKCYHLSYGMVVRPDGKMSSRTGNSFTFFQLVEVIVEELKKHMTKYESEWNQQQIDETVHKLAVAAIKYGMLASDPQKEIVFDPENWVRFDGNSGPYLMYSYARSKSIIVKAKDKGIAPSFTNLNFLNDDSEKELIMKIVRFNEIMSSAQSTHRPSTICNYLFELCKSFNQFYVKVPILKSEKNEEIAAKLSLVESFAMTLQKGLSLIGITTVEKM